MHQGRRRHRTHLTLDRGGTAARDRHEAPAVHTIGAVREPESAEHFVPNEVRAATEPLLYDAAAAQ